MPIKISPDIGDTRKLNLLISTETGRALRILNYVILIAAISLIAGVTGVANLCACFK